MQSSPYGSLWPLLNQRDRNRVYEIIETCTFTPDWFDENYDGIIEKLPPKSLIRLLKELTDNTYTMMKEVKEDLSTNIREGLSTGVDEDPIENMVLVSRCYQDMRRIKGTAISKYNRWYGNNE